VTHIYKIVSQSEWRAAEAAGVFSGAAVDLADGFIHFSAADQVEETAARYFAGQTDLLLVAVDAADEDVVTREGREDPAQLWRIEAAPEGTLDVTVADGCA